MTSTSSMYIDLGQLSLLSLGVNKKVGTSQLQSSVGVYIHFYP